MNLSDIDLGGYGRFDTDGRPAVFTVEKLNLPTSWDYIYQNRAVLLRVDQHGPVHAQADPPTDIVLFRREPFQRYSSWLVWLRSDTFKCGAFTNFFRPLPGRAPNAEPDAYAATYSPECATWTIEHERVRCVTTMFVPPEGSTVCQQVTVKSLRDTPLKLSLVPALRPYANPATLAPWDKPEWYLKTTFVDDGAIGFLTQLLNTTSHAEKRRAVVLWSQCSGLVGAEISYERFVGQGTFDAPESVVAGRLGISPQDAGKWGEAGGQGTIFGYPPVHALEYDITLEPGQTKTLSQVLSMLPPTGNGSLPDLETAQRASACLDAAARSETLEERGNYYGELFAKRSVTTPDKAFDSYVNGWLPLQMDWVASLDRGWPSGMRGTRDSAGDFTAMVPLAPAWSREILQALFSCQRLDGWFPRQYSAHGRKGKHDLRRYADGGVFVLELLYEYLCYTKDWMFLEEGIAWLDSDKESTVLVHALRTLDFYTSEENIGEHGLCKIGEGDWLDAVNRAGLRGRGESVTVTNQVIVALREMNIIVREIESNGLVDLPAGLPESFEKHSQSFSASLLEHAFNNEGYFNSVFNDDGRWLFSCEDPDGERRVYGPANWHAVISRVASGNRAEKILQQMDFLKCDAGYRLFWPPMGKVPIEHVGRVGSGDVPAGLWENGNAYNHGSHGFLGRALAVAGKGDLLFEVLKYLLPYDQEKHPVDAVMTPPYAVVNCWQEVPGFRHRGGMTFLTGSIAYGMRMVYSWMFGIQPMPDCLLIDPCIPSAFDRLEAHFAHLNKCVHLRIENPRRAQTGVSSMSINGNPVGLVIVNPMTGRKAFAAGDKLFSEEDNTVDVIL